MDLPPSAPLSQLFALQYETFFFFPPPPELPAAPSETVFTPWCRSLGKSVLTKLAVRSPLRLFCQWQKYKLQHFFSRGFCQIQAVLCEAVCGMDVELGAEKEICS